MQKAYNYNVISTDNLGDDSVKIAICDDESLFIDMIAEHILNIMRQYDDIDCTIYNCTSGEQLIDLCSREDIEMVCLDIAMPGLDGCQTACRLREINRDVVLIFISNNETMVFSTYEYEPIWFVPKSRIDMLESAVKKGVGKLQMLKYHKRYVGIKVTNRVVEIDTERVSYFVTGDHYVKMIYADDSDSVSYRCKLDDIERQLGDEWFVRSHKRYLVNCRAAVAIEGSSFVLKNGDVVPISKSYINAAKSKFHEYLRRIR